MNETASNPAAAFKSKRFRAPRIRASPTLSGALYDFPCQSHPGHRRVVGGHPGVALRLRHLHLRQLRVHHLRLHQPLLRQLRVRQLPVRQLRMLLSRPLHVAVVGAAGGLGQGILDVCRDEGIGFTAIVRSRPERITDVPTGSRVTVVTSLADCPALAAAFAGADAVLTALGVTATSQDRSASLSANMDTVEQAMADAGVDRIVMVNTLLTSLPGQPASLLMRLFSRFPGTIGRGTREQQSVADALGRGALSSTRWALVRGGLNARGSEERPLASTDWAGASNSWKPVSYRAMGEWMLEEAAANAFVRAAPLVSRGRNRSVHPGARTLATSRRISGRNW